MKYSGFEEMVGRTPVVQFKGHGIPEGTRLWVKLEGYNPTGSVKDRAGLRMIQDALKSGRLKAGMTLLDASSGNMACAIAFFGRVSGFKVRVACSSKLTEDKAAFLTYFGAELERVGNFTIEGNRHCKTLAETRKDDGYCFLDQLHNWSNPQASYDTMGPEILADFSNISAVVGSLGSGGTMTGTGRFLKEKRPQIAIYTVESAIGTKLPGTGSFCEGDYVTPFIEKARQEKIFTDGLSVSEADAVKRTRELRDHGFFCGLQTGGVVQSAIAAIRRDGITGDVVAISGDSGWKNMNKLMAI